MHSYSNNLTSQVVSSVFVARKMVLETSFIILNLIILIAFKFQESNF